MKGAIYMTKRAEYRKTKEKPLFEKVIEWALADNQQLIAEIVQQALADDDAENWLTLHPTSSFTGLTNYYFEKITGEMAMLGNEKRLLKKQFDIYTKKLLG